MSSSEGESWGVPAGVESEVGSVLDGGNIQREAGMRELLARRIHGERSSMVMSSPGGQGGSPGALPGSPGVIGQSSVEDLSVDLSVDLLVGLLQDLLVVPPVVLQE